MTDVILVRKDFPFGVNEISSKESFIIVDDDICEYDELVNATFEFGAGIESTFNAREGSPNVTFIVIKDDDSELQVFLSLPAVIIVAHFILS